MAKPHARDANLDLLRAAAIVLVLLHHVHQMWPSPLAWLTPFSELGAYGVDLFFVLSGYLIGGIYWRQHKRDGSVPLMRFWGRRWMRTLPPYVAGMLLAWAAVHVHRQEPFDLGYLVFIQNYYHELPFFLVSWSLCVEEHFYLAMPILMMLACRLGVVQVLLGCLFVLPLVLRLIDAGHCVDEPFGLCHTATHLHMSGLALGVWAAYVRCNKPERWQSIQTPARWLAVPMLLACLSIAWWPDAVTYQYASTLLAVSFTTTLVATAERKALPLAKTRVCYSLAISSYSIYLTHALGIHAGRMLSQKLPAVPSVVMLAIWLVLIGVLAGVFYFAVEWSSIRLREKWLPAKPKAAG